MTTIARTLLAGFAAALVVTSGIHAQTAKVGNVGDPLPSDYAACADALAGSTSCGSAAAVGGDSPVGQPPHGGADACHSY